MVSDKTRQEIAWELRKIEPCVNIAVEYVTVPDTDGQQVVVLHADKEKFNNAPYVYDGRPYYKLESTTMLMPQQMYDDMLRERSADKYRWDDMVADDMTIEDLDEKCIRIAVIAQERKAHPCSRYAVCQRHERLSYNGIEDGILQRQRPNGVR